MIELAQAREAMTSAVKIEEMQKTRGKHHRQLVVNDVLQTDRLGTCPLLQWVMGVAGPSQAALGRETRRCL